MIDVHTHVVPRQLPFENLPGEHWPRIEVGADAGEVFLGEQHFRTVQPSSWDLDLRAEEMRGHGVERQVLSPMPELFCYWAGDEAADAYCRAMNEWLAAGVRSGDDRFDAFGIVPMQSPDRAAAMLTEVAALGLRGVEIGSNIDGVPLHDGRFADFFTEVERLQLAVFVHAFHPHLFESFSGAPSASAVTFPTEIGLAAGGLIAEGVFHRHPDLRVCASHGAGSLGLLLPRMDRMWDFDPSYRERIPEQPSVTARRLFVDCLVFAPHALEFVLDAIGIDRVVVGSDYPFMPDRPGLILEEMTGLDPTDLEQISAGNARVLLGDHD